MARAVKLPLCNHAGLQLSTVTVCVHWGVWIMHFGRLQQRLSFVRVLVNFVQVHFFGETLRGGMLVIVGWYLTLGLESSAGIWHSPTYTEEDMA